MPDVGTTGDVAVDGVGRADDAGGDGARDGGRVAAAAAASVRVAVNTFGTNPAAAN